MISVIVTTDGNAWPRPAKALFIDSDTSDSFVTVCDSTSVKSVTIADIIVMIYNYSSSVPRIRGHISMYKLIMESNCEKF